MQERRIAQFVHIEKTAGTSIRNAVEEAVGKENVYVYSPQADRLTRSSEGLKPVTSPLLDKIRLGFSNPVIGPLFMLVYPKLSSRYKERIRNSSSELSVPDDAKVVFGHFAADRFDNILPSNTDTLRAVVIREPLERMRSHYDHWKRTQANEDWRVHVNFKKLPFQDFALLPEMQNYQSQALAGNDINTFDIVGTSEYAEEFTNTFIEAMVNAGLALPNGAEKVNHKRYNQTPNNRKTTVEGLDATFIQQFQTFHSEDYRLYARASQIQNERMSK